MNNFKLIVFCIGIIIIIVVIFSICFNKKNSYDKQTTTISYKDTQYGLIIEEYKRFVDCLINEGIESVLDKDIFSTDDDNLEYNWNCMMIEVGNWSYRDFPKNKETFGYALKDLNGDEEVELILLLQDYTVLAIFTTVDEKTKLVDAYWPRHSCTIYASGLLGIRSSGGASYWSYKIQQMQEDSKELMTIDEYGSTIDNGQEKYYKIIGGETYDIEKTELNDFIEEKFSISRISFSENTRKSGIQFIQLF